MNGNRRAYGLVLPLLTAGAVLLAGVASAGKYTLVGTTLNEMMRAPASFCAYASQNAASFGNEFQGCLADNVARRNRQIDEEMDRCDEIFFDADLRLGCYGDHGVPDLENQVGWLTVLNNAIYDGPNCPTYLIPIEFLQTTWEQNREESIFLGLEPPPPWEELWAAARDGMAKDYSCGSDDEDDPWWKFCFIEVLAAEPP